MKQITITAGDVKTGKPHVVEVRIGKKVHVKEFPPSRALASLVRYLAAAPTWALKPTKAPKEDK